jgi:hypothetical protein
MPERESGWYWVKLKGAKKWKPAYYEGDGMRNGWSVFGCSLWHDDDDLRIGERIKMPDEE